MLGKTHEIATIYGFNSIFISYLAKIPRYQISASPDIAISTFAQISRPASLIYASTPSPTLTKFGGR